MKNGLIIAIAVLAVGCGYLYHYRKMIQRPAIPQQHEEMGARIEAFSYEMTSAKLPYRLYQPDSKTSKRRLPLILYLGGGNGRGDDNLAQLDAAVAYLTSDQFQRMFKSFVFIPQCASGHQWVDLKNETLPYRNYKQNEIAESVYQKMVMNVMGEIIDRYPVDADRIYVMGYSMGATGSWDFITRHPDKFTAAIIVSGRSDPSLAKKISHLPIWLFHGRFDRVSPIENSEAMIDQLRRFGSKAHFTKLFRGHLILNNVMDKKGLFSWLFSQKKSS